VIDSWSLPWLTSKGVRLHLLASLDVRARRAAARAKIPVELARARIARKDEETRQLFLRLYGFDIMERHESLFHFTLDTRVLDAEEVLAEAGRFLKSHWAWPRFEEL
jgi:cytidylate kinase